MALITSLIAAIVAVGALTEGRWVAVGVFAFSAVVNGVILVDRRRKAARGSS